MDSPNSHTPISVRVQDRQDAFIPKASDEFVVTPEMERITTRALAYMDAGYPVHFTGVAGTGKTSLAFHVAAKLDQPAVLLHGDDEYGRSDLVGGEVGYRKSKVVDNFIRSVLKTDEQVKKMWEENRLAKACREGYTLIYDEFTRSRAEANNVLLSILEERILNLPARTGGGDGYIRVHPNFRAIFTSNTEEYAGTHKTQSALLDRLITIELDYQDRETEIQIAQARSGISAETASTIVDVVRTARQMGFDEHGPSVRAAIALSRVFADREEDVEPGNRLFYDACVDVLRPSRRSIVDDDHDLRDQIEALVDEVLRG
jgi:gas vesicle protein GvpN